MDGCVCLFVPFVLSFKASHLYNMSSVITAQSSPPSLLCDLTVIRPASVYRRSCTSCCASIFQWARPTSAHMVLSAPSHNLILRIIFSSMRDKDWWDDYEISSCLSSCGQLFCPFVASVQPLLRGNMLGVDRFISKYTFLAAVSLVGQRWSTLSVSSAA